MATLTAETSEHLIQGFRAIADPLRFQVLDLLRAQELCVCDLCNQLNVSPSKLSFHLKTLKVAQLVRSRQSGKWIYYSLNLPQLALLEQHLADFRRFSPMVPATPCGE
ncbi:MAG: ArsR/SmtB family transcription factor [Leptolyngbyaceae cyanobacterium]